MYLRQCLRRLALLRHHNLHLLRCRTLTQRFRNGHSALLSVFRNDRRLSLHHPWSRPFRLQVRMHCNRQWILSIQVLMLFAFSRPARWVPCSRLLHLMKRILSWLHLWPAVRNLSQQVMLRATARGICCPGLHGPSNHLILVILTPSCLLCALVGCILILVRHPGALPLASATTQGEPAGTLSSMRESSAVGDTPTSSGKPQPRPSSMLTCTHPAKSLHSHPVRTSQNARLRPVVHLKASVGNPVACPKPRPVPSA